MAFAPGCSCNNICIVQMLDNKNSVPLQVGLQLVHLELGLLEVCRRLLDLSFEAERYQSL